MPSKTKKQQRAMCAALGDNPKGSSKEIKKSMTKDKIEHYCKALKEGDVCGDMTGLSDKEGVTRHDVDPKQLEMGIKVEYEHTKDKDIAERIALDHLAEIPDYYTRLKKMEDEALKKESVESYCKKLMDLYESSKGPVEKHKYGNADACKDPERNKRLFDKSKNDWNKKGYPKPPKKMSEGILDKAASIASAPLEAAADAVGMIPVLGDAGDIAQAIMYYNKFLGGVENANKLMSALKTEKDEGKRKKIGEELEEVYVETLYDAFYSLLQAVSASPEPVSDVVSKGAKWLSKPAKWGILGGYIKKGVVQGILSDSEKLIKTLRGLNKNDFGDTGGAAGAPIATDDSQEKENEKQQEKEEGMFDEYIRKHLTKIENFIVDAQKKLNGQDNQKVNIVGMLMGKVMHGEEDTHPMNVAEDKKELMSVKEFISMSKGRDIICFDTETTGLEANFKGAQITEIAAIVFSLDSKGDAKLKDQFHRKIELTPNTLRAKEKEDESGEPMVGNTTISKLLGFTGYDKLDAKEVSEERGLTEFKDFVEKQSNPVLLAHNLTFDLKMVNTKLKSYGLEPLSGMENIDSLTIAKNQLKTMVDSFHDEQERKRMQNQLKKFNLTSIGQFLGAPDFNAHIAIEDVKQLIEIYSLMVKWMESNQKNVRWDSQAMGKNLKKARSFKKWAKGQGNKLAKQTRKANQQLDEETVVAYDLEDKELKKKIFTDIQQTADAQRYGDAERLSTGSKSPLVQYGTGQYQWMAEHIGDLTHRMAQKNSEVWGMGYEWVKEKVKKVLDTEKYYGLEKEVLGQAKGNSQYYQKEENRKYWNDQFPLPNNYVEWMRELKAAGKKYAIAHSKIPVFNEAQWLARAAAIALGLFEFKKVVNYLYDLSNHLDSEKDWIEYASTFELDDQGNILPYQSNTSESCIYDKDPEEKLINKDVEDEIMFDRDPEDCDLSSDEPDPYDLSPDMEFEDYVTKLQEMLNFEFEVTGSKHHSDMRTPKIRKVRKCESGSKIDKGGRKRRVGVMETIRRSNAAKNKVQTGSDKARKVRSASMRPTRRRKKK
jgi:DNA polymerase III epsilon subunit-like protein